MNESNHEIKNLDLFAGPGSGRSLEDCIIIDNNIFCFQKNVHNGILIPKYERDPTDNILEHLAEYLDQRFTLNCDDVRPLISKDMDLEAIINQTRASVIK